MFCIPTDLFLGILMSSIVLDLVLIFFFIFNCLTQDFFVLGFIFFPFTILVRLLIFFFYFFFILSSYARGHIKGLRSSPSGVAQIASHQTHQKILQQRRKKVFVSRFLCRIIQNRSTIDLSLKEPWKSVEK